MSTDLAKRTPDQAPLMPMQARRLSGLTSIDAADLVDRSVAEISEQYRWRIDPQLLLFEQICGTVVKQDPSTGVQYPVPGAIVKAEDTVCSMLGLFPLLGPWAWMFPFWCETELVREATTNACGEFCMWVPRFEIEWILRFRRERICYLEVLRRPTIENVLQRLEGETSAGAPGAGGGPREIAEQLLGGETARRLAASAGQAFGASNAAQQQLLARRAFPMQLAPPLPRELRARVGGTGADEHRAAVRDTLATRLSLDADALAELDLACYRGPFLRCFDVVIPEWVPILEVPDISFSVTQDVNGDGVQEVIYSEGLFDVAWDAAGTSNVTLLASQIAVSVATCNSPELACEGAPSLEYAGLMPLVNQAGEAPFVDAVAGFASRPNPPHPPFPPSTPGGTIGGPSQLPASAPYTGTLQLYGCTQVDGAVYYRLQYAYTAPGSATASALTPFKGLTWPLYRENAAMPKKMWQAPDSEGWYPILAPDEEWWPPSMVLEWDTGESADGLYTVQLEVGDAGKAVLAVSDSVGFAIDNSAPSVTCNAQWSFAADMSDAQPLLPGNCAVIERGVTPVDVYIQAEVTVNANHLRSVEVGCEGCSRAIPATSPADTVEHWYEDAADSHFSETSTYKISASDPQGAYSIDVTAVSRAFNPAGSDDGQLVEWFYNPVYRYTPMLLPIAIVNEGTA
jgi:hypothetical protein